MRLVLTGLNSLVAMPEEPVAPRPGLTALDVLYCAVCRTDAKMWSEGHRDLVFPRVPGHEFVGRDQTGARWTVWPGTACGTCGHCRSGRENLCEQMKITGFHHDGGFAHHVMVPEKSLIPVPVGIRDHLVCFAEPAGCVHNALEKLAPKPGERMIVFGGGTVGLIAALAARSLGVEAVVIEKSAAKIEKSLAFLNRAGIRCCKETTASEFDLAVNACPDPIAFSLCVTKLGKGGRLAFFSGLKKNETIETNLFNLLHYKENQVVGSYGLTRRDMTAGLDFIAAHGEALEGLVEAIVPPLAAPDLMPAVLAGNGLKYILDFSDRSGSGRQSVPPRGNVPGLAAGTCMGPVNGSRDVKLCSEEEQLLAALPRPVLPVGDELRAEARFKIDDKSKPLGALGKLEDLAVQLSVVRQTLNPRLDRKALFVFAGDHGIAEAGVSAYPAEVTGQMVRNFLNGGAAINVLAGHHGIDLLVVDMGVNADFEDHPLLIRKKIRKGTRNFALQAAMTVAEALQAVRAGMEVFLDEHARRPIDILGVGEMGIANSSSASAIISTVTGITPRAATGRGTGVDDKGLDHKAETIEKALAFLQPQPRSGLDILCKVGGFEIAGIAGAVLAAASQRTAVVLDGLISTAADLIAYLICPAVGGYLISGHKSVEIGQKAALAHMGLEPLIDFDMRLGEGTGAALAIDVAAAACRIMTEMASFEEAKVSGSLPGLSP